MCPCTWGGTFNQGVRGGVRSAAAGGAQRDLRRGKFGDQVFWLRGGELLDVGQFEELNTVVPSERSPLVRPPGVEIELGGVAFRGVDDEAAVTFGAGLMVNAVGGVGHE